MAQEVYKNESGQVLFGNSGNVFRKPYEFGLGFDNTRSTHGTLVYENMYIQCKVPPNLNVNGNVISMMGFFKQIGVSDRGMFRFESNSYASALGFGANNESNMEIDYNKTLETTSGASTTTKLTGLLRDIGAGLVLTDGINKAFAKKITKSVDLTSINLTTESYNTLTICRGARGTNTLITPAGVIRLNRMLFFLREISQDEWLYFYNNQLGSNPQSLSGVFLDINCSMGADILDFSVAQDGSDLRVGFPDSSGNNYHGEVVNLPVGTLQEQKDFVNNNLMFPF